MCVAWEALLPTVSAGLGVSAKAGDQGEVKVEGVHEPLHICPAVRAEDLRHLWLLRAPLIIGRI